MPINLLQEDEDSNIGYNAYNMTDTGDTVLDSGSNIVDYNKYPTSRINKDLRNATGELEQLELNEIYGSDNQDNIDESFAEIKRGEKNDPRDLNGDGVVSWGESINSATYSGYENVKSAVSAGASTISSGIEATVNTAKKVSLAAGDIDGDGDVDIHDLGAGFVGAGQNLREATGINAAGAAIENSTNNLIYVGGAVVLVFLLMKY